MRMSSGPTRSKLNPRSASMSCRVETPMSSSTPSTAPTPSTFNASSRSPKFACARLTFCPNRRSRSSARASASPSRSSPTSRPAGAIFLSIASACPPSPSVASTMTAPGRGARYASTSSTRTGTCIVACGDSDAPIHTATVASTTHRQPRVAEHLQRQRLELLRQFLRRLPNLLEPPAPGGGAPELQVSPHPDDRYRPRDARVLAQVRREKNPALPIQLAILGRRQHVPARLVLAQRQRPELLFERLPLRRGEGEETRVGPPGDDDAVAHDRPKFGRNHHPPFVVQRVLRFAPEHPPPSTTAPLARWAVGYSVPHLSLRTPTFLHMPPYSCI